MRDEHGQEPAGQPWPNLSEPLRLADPEGVRNFLGPWGQGMAVNTFVSVCLGGALPLLLPRLKVDPALLSGPILTTVTDTCGFFLALSVATVVLPKLVSG